MLEKYLQLSPKVRLYLGVSTFVVALAGNYILYRQDKRENLQHEHAAAEPHANRSA